MAKIVIYGGAFSPPHIGHAIALDAILRLFLCDEIWVMPSANRKDKTMDVDGEDRVQMLTILVRDLFSDTPTPIKISRLEIERPKLTTTHRTKQELYQIYSDAEFYFVIGSDIFPDIETKWFEGKELYRTTHFIVLQRNEVPLPPNAPENIVLLNHDTVWLNVSSTFIRKLLREGHSGVPYLTHGVAEYIKKKGLYQ